MDNTLVDRELLVRHTASAPNFISAAVVPTQPSSYIPDLVGTAKWENDYYKESCFDWKIVFC
jgi:hypothetical protein